MSLRSAPLASFFARDFQLHSFSAFTTHVSAFLKLAISVPIQREVADMLDMCLDPQINTNLYDRHLVRAA
jgi:hypothetical protein